MPKGDPDVTESQSQARPNTATLVKNLMTAHAEWVGADTPVREVARKMRDKGIGCLPVGEHDRLIGMITDRDITTRVVAESAVPSAATPRRVPRDVLHQERSGATLRNG